MAKAELLPGTLDVLILKAISLGGEHGYGILQRIERSTGDALSLEQGALYPALFRLEHQGLLRTEWGTSDNNRKAKFYALTPAGVGASRPKRNSGAPTRWRSTPRWPRRRPDAGAASRAFVVALGGPSVRRRTRHVRRSGVPHRASRRTPRRHPRALARRGASARSRRIRLGRALQRRSAPQPWARPRRRPAPRRQVRVANGRETERPHGNRRRDSGHHDRCEFRRVHAGGSIGRAAAPLPGTAAVSARSSGTSNAADRAASRSPSRAPSGRRCEMACRIWTSPSSAGRAV